MLPLVTNGLRGEYQEKTHLSTRSSGEGLEDLIKAHLSVSLCLPRASQPANHSSQKKQSAFLPYSSIWFIPSPYQERFVCVARSMCLSVCWWFPYVCARVVCACAHVWCVCVRVCACAPSRTLANTSPYISSPGPWQIPLHTVHLISS